MEVLLTFGDFYSNSLQISTKINFPNYCKTVNKLAYLNRGASQSIAPT